MKSCALLKGKRVWVHLAILTGFILYLVFFAVPLFNAIGNPRYESSLVPVTLPEPTDNITCAVDYITVISDALRIFGYAFLKGENTADHRIYVVLRPSDKPEEYRVYDTQQLYHPDSAIIVNGKFMDAGHSRFVCTVPMEGLRQGAYRPGIYIEQDSARSLQYLDYLINVKGGTAEAMPVSARKTVNLPPESQDIVYSIDTLRKNDELGLPLIEIIGWAFIQGRDSVGAHIDVVMASALNTYIFDGMPDSRPGVTEAFKSLNLDLDNSGFVTRIRAGAIQDGTYRVGLYITRGEEDSLLYTDTFMYKSGDSIQSMKGKQP